MGYKTMKLTIFIFAFFLIILQVCVAIGPLVPDVKAVETNETEVSETPDNMEDLNLSEEEEEALRLVEEEEEEEQEVDVALINKFMAHVSQALEIVATETSLAAINETAVNETAADDVDVDV